jgi:predicted CopG family antitoxin
MKLKEMTTINVTQEVWFCLVQKKKSPKETFDDVLRRELKIEEKKE